MYTKIILNIFDRFRLIAIMDKKIKNWQISTIYVTIILQRKIIKPVVKFYAFSLTIMVEILSFTADTSNCV